MRLLTISLCAALVAGCSEAPSVSCNDDGVKALALEASRNVLKEQLFKLYLRNEAGMLPRSYAEMTYAEFKAEAEGSDEQMFHKVVTLTDDTLRQLKLSDVRTMGTDQETGRVSCAANLASDEGGGAGIEYTAQITAEGKTYVEVSGL